MARNGKEGLFRLVGFVYPFSDHVMVPQKTVSFKCHPIYYARAYDKAKGTFP